MQRSEIETLRAENEDLKKLVWAATPIIYFQKYPNEDRIIENLLPDDMIRAISLKLKTFELLPLRLVCRRWRRALDAEQFWKQMCEFVFPNTGKTLPTKNYKNFFIDDSKKSFLRH
jgi:hypothetical protein